MFGFGVSVCRRVWIAKKKKKRKKRKEKQKKEKKKEKEKEKEKGKGKRDPFPPGFLPQVGTKTPSLIGGRFQL